MSYDDALAYLDSHSNYDTTGRITSPTLDRMRALMAAMGDPQLAYPVIHVTGTNGKGSTTQMITRLLMAHGLSVGTYTSPHLERLNERLKARDEYGLVIADEQHQYGPQLTRLVGQWKDQGTGGYRGQVLSRILDAVHFVDSKVSPMTQLADIAAYVHRRRLFVPTESNPNAEAAMKMLHDLVLVGVPDPTGQYVTTWYG